jgi:hypothetical protein
MHWCDCGRPGCESRGFSAGSKCFSAAPTGFPLGCNCRVNSSKPFVRASGVELFPLIIGIV